MSDKLIKNKSGRVVAVPENMYNQFVKDGLIGKDYFDVETKQEVKVEEYKGTVEDVEKHIEALEVTEAPKEIKKAKLNSKKK